MSITANNATPGTLVVIAIVLLAGTVNLAQLGDLGSVSGLGALTIIECAAAWMLSQPLVGRTRPLLPILMLALYAVASMTFNPPTVAGVQNILVLATFCGATVLTAGQIERDARASRLVSRAFDVALLVSLALYVVADLHLLPRSKGDDGTFSTRGFALFVLIALAKQLASWRHGSRLALWMSVVTICFIFHSLSRMALVMGSLLFPLAVMMRGDRRALKQTVIVCVLIASVLGTAVALYPPLHARFFSEDPIRVGAVSINMTGRMRVWHNVFESFTRHMICGQGAGSTASYTNVPGMGHPHNDYLRIAHDYGLIGLALWVAGLTALLVRAAKAARRPGQARDLSVSHLTAFLALVAVCASMFTDNPFAYVFVMAPLGVAVGWSIGASRRVASHALIADDAARPFASAQLAWTSAGKVGIEA